MTGQKNGNGSEQKTQEPKRDLPEAPASINFRFSYKGYEPTLTLRDFNGLTLLSKLDAALKKLEAMGAVAPGAAATSLVFEATKLAASVLPDAETDEVKTYWKVKGGSYRKFGVSIWPEALEEAGFVVEEMVVTRVYDLAGWTAHCEVKDGQPRKVTKLVPPAKVE
jgi:hypothetical protein